MTRIFCVIFAIICIALAVIACSNYEGQWYVYLVFTLIANALLFNGFRKNSIYFDTFIGLFLWLGFWLKFSIRTAFIEGKFHEATGAFDGSAQAFDHALTVACCGLAGLLIASFIRQKFFRYTPSPPSCESSGLFKIYRTWRKTFISIFLLLVLVVAVSNVQLGIYQRGMVAQTTLPFGLNGLYKWLLQFGLASIAAMIIRFEIELNRNVTLMAVFPPLLESFFSNVSLLSRGMILNATALGFGSLRTLLALKIRIDFKVLVVAIIVFCTLFVASVLAVNYLRASSILQSIAIQDSIAVQASSAHPATSAAPSVVEIDKTVAAGSARDMTAPLFIDRWVGMEGVMAVSSSHRLGWDLWREAWREKFQEGQLTLYDRYFIKSPYALPSIDNSKHHFVSLPGVVAFFYYSGALWFVFFGLLVLGGAAAFFEFVTYRFAGQNWVLCSLFAQVVAFRYASFGYVPSQSYLLFGTLLLNVLLIAGADWLTRWFLDHRRAHP